MAGGRRPANFAASTRHSTGSAERDASNSATYYSIWNTVPPVLPARTSSPAQTPGSLPSFASISAVSSSATPLPGVTGSTDGSPVPPTVEHLTLQESLHVQPRASPSPESSYVIRPNPPPAPRRHTQPGEPVPSGSDALAAALDVAVSSAVQRALTQGLLGSTTGHVDAACGGLPPPAMATSERIREKRSESEDCPPHDVQSVSPEMHEQTQDLHRGVVAHCTGYSDSSEGPPQRHGYSVSPTISPSHETAKSEHVRTAAVLERLEQEMLERKRENKDLHNSIAALKEGFDSAHSKLKSESAAAQGALRKRVASAEKIAKEASEEAQKQASVISMLKGELRATQEALANSEAHRRSALNDAERLRVRLVTVESQLDDHGDVFDGLPRRMNTVESFVRELQDQNRKKSESKVVPEPEELAKHLRLLKDAVKASRDAQESANGLRSRVKRMESSLEAAGKRNEETFALQGGSLDSLRTCLQETSASITALKRLVEANLRSHSSAEGIVKDQAQLITRHVCVALRQFISRRISENNALIDKALRARIPQYAEAGEEFVLVREHDVAPSTEQGVASEAANGVSDLGETSTILRRDVLDKAMSDFETRTDGERAR